MPTGFPARPIRPAIRTFQRYTVSIPPVSRLRMAQTGADLGNRRLAGDIKFYRGVGLHVRDARAAPDIAAMVPFYGDTFGLALPDQVSPELRGAGVGAEHEAA